jgi:hypothetical protein
VTDVNVNLPILEGTLVVKHAVAESKAPAAGFDATPWKTGIEQFRASSRWVIGAFAGIGAVIVAAVPFAAFSDVTPTSRGTVVWGAALALGGVALAIAATSATLIPRMVYLSDVKSKKRWVFRRSLSHTLAVHPSDVFPAGILTVQDLRDAITNLDALAANQADDETEAAFAAASATHRDALDGVLWYRRFEKARTSFRASLIGIVLGALVTGGGVGLLLYGLDDAKSNTEILKIQADVAKLEADTNRIKAETTEFVTDASGKRRAEVAGVLAAADKANAESTKLLADAKSVSEKDPIRAQLEIEKIKAEIDKLKAEATKLRAEATK